jgi:hypothetical protein
MPVAYACRSAVERNLERRNNVKPGFGSIGDPQQTPAPLLDFYEAQILAVAVTSAGGCLVK